MKTNIFVPNKINIGFQNRNGTYTGKLAYIIYWDEKGKLRKEKSWNSWRDESIPNEEFDNVPTEGFVLNKKVGGYSGSWGNFRQSYTRVYDPRGFEFEITIPNLLWILECCNCIKGKGLEGEFVYGWDGTELLLVPVDSPDYKEIKALSDKVNECNYIDKNDLKVGATYITKGNVEYVYMGRFDKYEYCYLKDGKVFETYKRFENYCIKNGIPPVRGRGYRYYRYVYKEDNREYASIGKYYCFGYYSSYGTICFEWIKSVKDTFIDVVNEGCSEKYSEFYEELEKREKFSPPDFTKNQIIPMSYEQFEKLLDHYYNTDVMYKTHDEEYEKITIRNARDNGINKFILFMNGEEVLDMFPTVDEEIIRYGRTYTEKHMVPVALMEIFDKIHPVYKQTYLANGNKYREEYTW